MRRGYPPGPVSATLGGVPRESDDLLDDLEIACLDAMRGDPPGPSMAIRLQTVVKAVLHSRGVAARVEAESTRRGTFVRLWVQRPGAKVREVVLSLGGS
jgi:hypothetical protein